MGRRREACTLPIDARTCIFIDFYLFQNDLKGWRVGGGCTLLIDVRTCIFIDYHWFSLISGGFEAIRARKLAGLWRAVATCGG